MRKLYPLYLLGCLFFIYGCNTKQDVNADYNIPNTEALLTTNDCENAILSAYGAMVSDSCMGGYMYSWPEVISDLVRLNPNKSPKDAEVYYRQMNPSSSYLLEAWSMAFQAINRANGVINALENGSITQTDQSGFAIYDSTGEKNRLLGEGLFIRAVMNFELLRLFAPQYTTQNANTPGLAIPLRLTPTVDRTVVPRATIQQVYDAVIADLTKAAPLLPRAWYADGGKDPYATRATSDACYAYLCRVMFQMGRTDLYPEILTYINKVIGPVSPCSAGSCSPQLDIYALASSSTPALDIFNQSQFDKSTETIWQISNASVVAGSIVSPYIQFSSLGVIADHYVYVRGTSFISPSYLISRQFNVQFFQNTSPLTYNQQKNGVLFALDYRINSSGIPFYTSTDSTLHTGYNSDSVINKFQWVSNGGVNLIQIRVPELLLMRAEINAETGNFTDCRSDMTRIRKYRQISFFPGSFSEKILSVDDDLINQVRQERIRELSFEGFRLHELRRLGALGVPNTVVGPGDRVGVAPLPWNSWQLVFPLPQSEIDLSHYTQNPNTGTY